MATALQIAIRAELTGLRKDLASTGQLTATEIRKMVSETRTAIKELENAGKASAATGRTAAAGMGQAAAATGNLRSQIFDVATSLQGGMNPLTVLSQQGPQIAEAMLAAGNGVQALKAALLSTGAVVGAVAAVLGPLYLGFRTLTEDSARAAEVAERVSNQYAALSAIMDDTRAKTVELAVATGQLSEAQGDAFAAGAAGLRQYNAATEETRKRLGEIAEGQQSWRTALADTVDAIAEVNPLARTTAFLIDGITTSTAEYEAEADTLRGTLTSAVDVLRTNVTVTNDLDAATRRNAEAARFAKDAAKDNSKAQREQAAALAELLALEQSRSDSLLSNQGRIEVTTARELDRIAELASAYSGVAEVQDAAYAASQAVREAAAEEMAAEVVRVQEAEAAKQAAIAAKFQAERDEARRTAMARIEQEHLVAEAQGRIAGAVADTASALAARVAEDNKEAATGLFAVAKAAALAQVAIDTALAVSKINATWAAVPPVAAALTAGAIAVGVAQAATIASQQPAFHTGGLVGSAPDEVSARLLPGEGVVSRQGMDALGTEALNRVNRGESPTASPSVSYLVYSGRVLDAYTWDAARRPGSPLRSITTAGKKKPGRR